MTSNAKLAPFNREDPLLINDLLTDKGPHAVHGLILGRAQTGPQAFI